MYDKVHGSLNAKNEISCLVQENKFFFAKSDETLSLQQSIVIVT